MNIIKVFLLVIVSSGTLLSQDIPLPEHPNPIKMRTQWQNLNGAWEFAFDSLDVGISEEWQNGDKPFIQTIIVPFSWGSKLSQVADDADIGWYKKGITVPSSLSSERMFIIIGASDWETHVWLDGQLVGSHQGGYVPFEFDLSDFLKYDQQQTLVIRVDDKRRPHTLYGKQGYGNARGIWQTIYFEVRDQSYIDHMQVTPDIDNDQATVKVFLPEPVEEETIVTFSITGGDAPISSQVVFKKDQRVAKATVDIPNPKLWTLENPYLYDIEASLGTDRLKSYFGMRKVSVMNLPGTDYPYIALNNKPIYLQLALDQSYHPEGFYTFPTDQFMIDEIERSKSIGLNGIRTHIKVEVPRKLYWADKLGLLVMEDLPNSWGEPEERMRRESTYTLEEMVKRDYNHPSIFSWVIMNETWGLFTDSDEGNKYLPETQKWVESLYHLTKSLDDTRIVEDNSICCGRGHTVTDLNSWHVYLPGYAWDDHLKNISDNSFEGSTFHYEEGYMQGLEPNINSECGNVWGYDGSAGDVDWSWDYHRMINAFRKYPKIGGWLYTEHHDVINEWNGYWRFDRSEKHTGLGDIVPGMTLNDLHSDIYISTGQDISYDVKAGSQLQIPLYLSSMTNRALGDKMNLTYDVDVIDTYGRAFRSVIKDSIQIDYAPWKQAQLDSLQLTIPDVNGIGKVQLILKTPAGEVVHRNFVHIIIDGASSYDGATAFSKAAKDYKSANWSKKTWDAMDGKKVNGAGSGHFEYEIEIPTNTDLSKAKAAYFIVEASAKELFVKDQEEYQKDLDFMRGSIVAPSSNPNSYPMTDDTKFPTTVKVYINGKLRRQIELSDDPADHRGVLSWHAQLKDRKLREAGSYGYPVNVLLNKETFIDIMDTGKMTVRLEVEGEGGMAIYGKDFGRYPFDPSLVVTY